MGRERTASASSATSIRRLLEKLGITARTSKTAAQRGAGKKAATTRQANEAAAATPAT